MRGGTCVWRESFWAPHTGPVFHLLHPELFFILKKSSPSKGSVNTNVVYVSINVQWVWLWAHICSHSTSASPQNLHQYVREAPRVSPECPPCSRTSLQSFFFPSPLGRVQPAAWGPAPPVRFCLAHLPLQGPTWGPSVPELHGDLWGVGRKEPLSPILCTSVTWALNWPYVYPESYKVFIIPALSALNSER